MTELAEVMCWRTRRCEAASLSRIGESGKPRQQPLAAVGLEADAGQRRAAFVRHLLASEAAALSFSRAMRLSP